MPMISWKPVAGFVLFLAVGVFTLEMLTAKKQSPEVHTHSDETQSADMQALPQIEALEKKVAANPNDSKSLLELANVLHDNRFYDKALISYSSYLGKNPRDTDARVDFGICYYDLGKLDEAGQQMERALKESPKHVLAHFNLGIVNLRAGRIEEANKWFKKTIELAPNSSAGQQAQQFLTQHSNSQKLSTK